jgi:hypothetical protein
MQPQLTRGQDYPRNSGQSAYVVPYDVSIHTLPGTFVFQAMELRHLRVAAPHRRITVTHPHGHPSPNLRIRPAVPLRAQTSSHNRRNVKVATGKALQLRSNSKMAAGLQAGVLQGGPGRSGVVQGARGPPGRSGAVQGAGFVFSVSVGAPPCRSFQRR